jgi:hypothetical protein
MNAPLKYCQGHDDGSMHVASVWLNRKWRCAECAQAIRDKHMRGNMKREAPAAVKFVQPARVQHTAYTPPPLRPLTYYDRMANVERARAWHELPSLVP